MKFTKYLEYRIEKEKTSGKKEKVETRNALLNKCIDSIMFYDNRTEFDILIDYMEWLLRSIEENDIVELRDLLEEFKKEDKVAYIPCNIAEEFIAYLKRVQKGEQKNFDKIKQEYINLCEVLINFLKATRYLCLHSHDIKLSKKKLSAHKIYEDYLDLYLYF